MTPPTRDPRVHITTIPRPSPGDDDTTVRVHWDYDPTNELPYVDYVEDEATGELITLTPSEDVTLHVELARLPIPPPLGPDPDDLYDDYRDRQIEIAKDHHRKRSK